MTRGRSHTWFAAILCLLVTGLAQSDLRSETASSGRKIFGTIVDGRQDFSEEDAAKLAAARSMEDFERVLGEAWGKEPPPVAVVTARGWNVTREVVSDANGKFTFTDLPKGVYEVSAKTKNGKQLVSPTKRVRVIENNGIVHLTLHEELLAVSGRITDAEGGPIAGAKVAGTPVPVLETGLIDRVSTVSDADGSFLLEGFAPLDLYLLAGFLNGGNLEAPGSLYTCVEIRVEVDGFVQERKDVPKVALVTEDQLVPARRLRDALSAMAEAMNPGETQPEGKERELSSTEGNRITGIEVVLDRAESDSRPEANR